MNAPQPVLPEVNALAVALLIYCCRSAIFALRRVENFDVSASCSDKNTTSH
jgi:hypothetical protein